MKNLEENCCNAFLQLKNVEKIYQGGNVGLLDINFSMCKNERIVFVGEAQSGKTTLLSLIAGVEFPTKGDIFLTDKNITNSKIKEKNFGFVESGLQLKNFKSVKTSICYPLKIRKFNKALIEEKLLFVLKQCEMEKFANKKIKDLTCFQKVVTALARLSIVDRDLYLIDDIFEKLSNNDIDKLVEIINKLFFDKSLIICTNSIEVAKKLQPDKIGILAYSTLCGFGKIYDREIFEKTIAGNKIYNSNMVACIPCKILDTGNLLVGDKEIDFLKKINSKIFENAILCVSTKNIKLSKNATFTGKIQFINDNNLMYVDFYDNILTMPRLDCLYKVGDVVSFDFKVGLSKLYDTSSEREISL